MTDSGRTTRPQPALSVDDLLAATGGTLLRPGGRPVRGGAVDSRQVRPGNLFIALAGEHTDGHRFLGDAARAGAAAALVGRAPDTSAGEAALDTLGDLAVIRVADPLRGLHAVATAWRRRFSPLTVGITGSIAKTSTKEAVAGVLARRYRTLRTEGNRNNEVGMPLAVLDLGPEHEALVLEMGMYTGGEIRDLAAIGRPAIGVVTAVQPVHLSRIGSLDAIEDAKAELVEALPPAAGGGVAVLNADDERVARMGSRTSARVVRYGFDPAADVRATEVQSTGFEGMRFQLATTAGEREVRIPGLGRLAVHNALAAVAVGLEAGLSLDQIVEGLAAPSTAPHRSAVVRAGGVAIVDDSYNASPGSMRAALELLAGLPGRHVAVLGHMLELGEASAAGHAAVGTAAASAADLLIVAAGTPGGAAAGIADGALAAGMDPALVVRAEGRRAAADAAAAALRPGDAVLVKGSQGIGLDEAVRDRLGVGLELLVADLAARLGGGRDG